jgi:hypothetical protein
MRTMRMMRFGSIAAVVAAISMWMLPASATPGSLPHESRPTTSYAEPAGNPAATTLAGEVQAARLATAKYATNLSRAKADGYQIITKMIPDMGFHFLNPSIQGFNVRKPQILVYEHHGRTWQLGALEWIFPKMPTTPPLPNATFGFFPAACHYKDGTFVPDKNAKTCAKKAPGTGAAFNFWHPDLITMHLWAWYPNTAGLYSSMNPLVTPFNGG